jgi:autophagy-related protein 18
MSFNQDGTMLASASSKGTVIRVYHMPHATMAFTFRRGTYPASIYSLVFSPSGEEPELLVAASSNGSVHLFHLQEQERYSVTRRR